MLDLIFLAELVHHVKQLLITLYLGSVHIDALHVLLELNRTVDLDLLVGRRAP